MITSLEDKQIIVIGSNLQGQHGAGAARQAYEDFGLEWGIGVGLSGQTYAIPTMEGIESLKKYVKQFLRFAELTPQYEYLMTPIGTGIAGHSVEEIAPLFENAPSNVKLPEGWLPY